MSSEAKSQPDLDWQLPMAAWAGVSGALSLLVQCWQQGAVAFCFIILWLLAILSTLQNTSRSFQIGTLKHRRYTQIYTFFVRAPHGRLWDRFCDPVAKDAPWLTQFNAALTARLYDRAMLIAVVYPMALLLAPWLLGGEGRLGDAIILPPATFWPDRAATIGAVALVAVSVVLSRQRASSPRRLLRRFSGWLPIVALAVAGAGAGALAGAGAVEFALAVAGAFAFAVAGAFAFAGAFAGAGAVAFAGVFVGAVAVALAVAGAGAVLWLIDRGRQRLANFIASLAIIAAFVLAFSVADFSEMSTEDRTFLLFLGILPLLNAVFDVVSYALTLSLMRRGFESRVPWLWGLVDVLAALVLFALLGAAMVAVISGLNALAGETIYPLETILADIAAHPGDYWWLYAMVFSTALPTASHGIASLISLQNWLPRAGRANVADWLAAMPHSRPAQALAPLALAMVWMIPLLLFGAVLWGAAKLDWPMLDALGSWYLDHLQNLETWLRV